MPDKMERSRHVADMVQRGTVNLVARAAQELGCTEWEVVQVLPPENVAFARPGCLPELWNELATWENVGIIMCRPGFSLESKGQLAPLTERGGMWHFYGKGLAGHIDLDFVCGVAFCSLPVRGQESHSVRFFARDGSHLVSVYVERDSNGRLTARGLEAYARIRRRFAG